MLLSKRILPCTPCASSAPLCWARMAQLSSDKEQNSWEGLLWWRTNQRVESRGQQDKWSCQHHSWAQGCVREQCGRESLTCGRESSERTWDGPKYNFSRASSYNSICLPQQTLSTAFTADPAALSGGGDSVWGWIQASTSRSPQKHTRDRGDRNWRLVLASAGGRKDSFPWLPAPSWELFSWGKAKATSCLREGWSWFEDSTRPEKSLPPEIWDWRHRGAVRNLTHPMCG